jgi:hypothetical protein
MKSLAYLAAIFALVWSLSSCAPSTTITETLLDGTVRKTEIKGGIDPSAVPLAGLVVRTYATINSEK